MIAFVSLTPFSNITDNKEVRENSRERSPCGGNEWVKWVKRSPKTLQEKQRERSEIFASSKSSVFDFFGPGCPLDLAQSDFSL